MKASDIPVEVLQRAEDVSGLLRRELSAIEKMQDVLNKVIDEEEARGLDVCASIFTSALWLLDASRTAVAAAIARGE